MPRRPVALVVAVGVVALEAAALGVVVVAYLLVLVRGGAQDAVGALATAALVALVAAALGMCAWALRAGRRWARSPLITWQLLQLLLGLFNITERPLPALVAVLAALAVLVPLFLPAVLRATGGQDRPPVL